MGVAGVAAHSEYVVHGGGKHELSTGQATGQMANKHVYAFIFRKMPFLGGQPLFIDVYWCLLTFMHSLLMVFVSCVTYFQSICVFVHVWGIKVGIRCR